MRSRKILVWIAVTAGLVACAAIFWLQAHHWRPRSIILQGAVIRNDRDPRKELPIADAEVTASDGAANANTQSDASGYFKLELGTGVWPNSVITLSVRHPDYQPLDATIRLGLGPAASSPYIAALKPLSEAASVASQRPRWVVSNVRIRYTVNLQTDTNIGSAAKTFQVDGRETEPCNHQSPCSPDGHWKATRDSVTLDAGTGNVFRNVRASCIAGPCPFTQIDSSGFAAGGRTITASALDWSDTATFLLEAEVFHNNIDSSERESYPVIFDRTLDFTLPPTQEGVSIEAEINGTPMVFPLGPDLFLSWADCTLRSNGQGDKSTVYQCELKPDYRF